MFISILLLVATSHEVWSCRTRDWTGPTGVQAVGGREQRPEARPRDSRYGSEGGRLPGIGIRPRLLPCDYHAKTRDSETELDPPKWSAVFFPAPAATGSTSWSGCTFRATKSCYTVRCSSMRNPRAVLRSIPLRTSLPSGEWYARWYRDQRLRPPQRVCEGACIFVFEAGCTDNFLLCPRAFATEPSRIFREPIQSTLEISSLLLISNDR